ncbi:MAG: IS91 family transposase [Deltaproteobacteria bacterium]|nr:MAG: IS91 family transposase [Deltaproteobacteria bacterium]
MPPHGSCVPKPSRRPCHEVADIFRAHGEQYRATHPLGPDLRKAMWCIEACRTAVLGGHVDVCPDCGTKLEPAYNSCRNRNCPKCQALDQDRWIDKRRERLLPAGCFHVVFTLPSALRAVAQRNRKKIFDTLFAAASQTLLELGKTPKHLGALLGITAVLHTWTRDLRFHPHLHCVVTAGGLALDESRWVDTRRRFLFPVGVMGLLFRGKFVAGLERLHRRGELDLGDVADPNEAFGELRAKLFSKKWVVYAKRPFAGPEQVFAYLGRYTHRIAISNHRILAVTDDAVTIATRNGNTATMPPLQFIHRFLQHVLPTGFVKIRHYGLWASANVKTKLDAARRLLEADGRRLDPRPREAAPDWREHLEKLTGIDLTTCPVCGSKRLRRETLPAPRHPTTQRPTEPP